MRFAQAHKTTSYLMVAAAFGALVTGGTVSPLTALLGFTGMITSWFWEPPRVKFERWQLAWTIASLLVLAMSVTLAFASGDILGTGADFLVWLVIVKAFNRRAARDWQQLYLLSFLMLVAGSVINTDLTYGVFFLIFVVAATWALILFHLRREMEDNFLLKHADDHSERVEVRRILESRRIVDRRFFVGTGAVSIGVFFLSAVIFLAIPRVGVGFFWKSRGGLNLIGFSDGSRLGGHGRLKSDSTVVMRVKVDGAYEGRDAPYLHWRGVAFDDYRDGAWSRSPNAPRTQEQPASPSRGRLRFFLDYDRDERTSAEIDEELGGAMHQDVWLEPLDSDVLFGASMPEAFEGEAPLTGARPRPEGDKNDATVVMRVEIASRYGGREAPELHWRGVAFDHYEHGQWSRRREAPATAQTLEESPTHDRRFLLWDGPQLTSAAIDDLATRLVRQDIWLDPLESDVLFGATAPRIVQYTHTLRPRKLLAERNDEIRLDHGSTIHYTVWSQLQPPPPDALRAASGPLPAGYEAYTRVPDQITLRTRMKAIEITAGKTNDYDKAVAIRDYLIKNMTYTLDLADPGDQEPIDFFLFDRKAGHCEYFASAFVILARAAGLPARDVNGFLGGEWNEYDDYIAVRAGDAHSWAEVYFPGQGWVTFDATPPSLVDELGRGGTGILARISRFFDTLRFHWTKWVVEYDLYQQLALFRSIGHGLSVAGKAVKAGIVAAVRWNGRHWPVPLALAAILAALLARRLRRRAGGSLAVARTHRARGPIAAAYAAALHRLARRGHPRDPAATPRELARDLAARGVPGAAELGELTELYYRAEWGGDAPAAAVARAGELRRAIEAALQR